MRQSSEQSTWNFHIVPFKRNETLRTRGTRTSVLILILFLFLLLFVALPASLRSLAPAESQLRILTLMLLPLLVLLSRSLDSLDTLLSATHLLCELPTYSVVLLCEQRLGAPPGWLAGWLVWYGSPVRLK